MTSALPDYLADLYRLEELEGWQLFARHLDLMEGVFSFVVVLAPDDLGIAYIRSQLPNLVESDDAVKRVVFNPAAEQGSLAESLLALDPLPSSTRIVWIDADPIEADQFPVRDKAWERALSRLNRYRNTLQKQIHCTLVIAGPMSLQGILRESAPDIWSIRSSVFRMEPVGSATTTRELITPEPQSRLDIVEIGLAGDPQATLAEAEKIRGKPGRELLLAQLLQRAGRQAVRMLQWDLAIDCLQKAYNLEKSHGGDPELRFSICNDLVLVFNKLAKFDRALYYANSALEIAEHYFGGTDPNTAVALGHLAQSLMNTNRLAEAEPLLRRALLIDDALFENDPTRVSVRLNNLALLLRETNRLSEAESVIRRALAIDITAFGVDHPRVAITASSLALLLKETSRLSEVEPLLRHALTIDEAAFGKQHPNVALDLGNLAAFFCDMDRFSEAEPLMRRALAIDESAFGIDHPNVARDLNNLSSLLQKTNRLTEAEPLIHRALAIDEAAFGPNHPRVARSLNNLAQLLQRTNRLSEVESLIRRAIAIDESAFGSDHPEFAVDLNNLAHLLVETNQSSDAEPLLRQCLLILQKFKLTTGHEHPNWQLTLQNYRRLLEQMGLDEVAIQKKVEELSQST